MLAQEMSHLESSLQSRDQGKFAVCASHHVYHLNCAMMVLGSFACLHCGQDPLDRFMVIDVHAGKSPIFFPHPQVPKKRPSAKMCFGGSHTTHTKPDEVPLTESIALTSESVTEMPETFTTDLEKEKLANFLSVASSMLTNPVPAHRYTAKSLYSAAKNGNTEKLISVLATGLNPNILFRECLMGSVLHLSSSSGHLSVVQILVQAGAQLDVLDRAQNTPLMLAVLEGKNEVVNFLIKAGASVMLKGMGGMTALHLATKSGNQQACQHILAIPNLPRDFIDTKDDGGWTPLVWAAEHSHAHIVEGARSQEDKNDIQKNGLGYTVVMKLLEIGGYLNKVPRKSEGEPGQCVPNVARDFTESVYSNTDADSKLNKDYEAVLSVAHWRLIWGGCVGSRGVTWCVRLLPGVPACLSCGYLLSKRANPFVRDAEQNIALHWSAFSGCAEITELLLNLGSDPNSTNLYGDTPLHIGARQNMYECVHLLLARRARLDLKNTAGELALDCCVSESSECFKAISLNIMLRDIVVKTLEPTVHILSNDISHGKEVNPVQCINWEDDEGEPTDYVYVSSNCFTSYISIDQTITSLQSCRCTDGCTSTDCRCNTISLGCPYDNMGRLVPDFNYADAPMVFECNQMCACNRNRCVNRVMQKSVTEHVQLFRTRSKGWGVRMLRPIPKGTYVCEYIGDIVHDVDRYIGEAITDVEADHREDDSYLFDLDNKDGETYCIDARHYGNVSRFINHMCVPNLIPVKVFVDHHDLHFPRIAFFANRDIDTYEELGSVGMLVQTVSFTINFIKKGRGAHKLHLAGLEEEKRIEAEQKKQQQEDKEDVQSCKTLVAEANEKINNAMKMIVKKTEERKMSPLCIGFFPHFSSFPRFDYGEKFWIIKSKSFTCECGADNCRYSKTTITQTLENYLNRLQEMDRT
uniref:Uncharacterized protein n=1 Tax=Timema douglasi TaxID=61478 RepID=A0A7R8VJQ0_TIMDO|nr:unnamed protein product [Timema douglasi]